eukprot:1176973-Prorocentrum_minimum.AAC.2
MNFESLKKVQGGDSKASLLERNKAERAARDVKRLTTRAAQTIQRIWRGHSVSTKMQAQLRKEWDAEFAQRIATGTSMSTRDIAGATLVAPRNTTPCRE